MKLVPIYLLGFGLLALVISCQRNLLGTPLNFSAMQIEHSLYGTWLNPSALQIDGNGQAVLYQRYQAKPDSVDSLTATLTAGERQRLAELFYGFDKLKSNYAPAQPIMDGIYQRIVLTYHNTSDTVSVYDAPHAGLPLTLNNIIRELEKIREDIQENHD